MVPAPVAGAAMVLGGVWYAATIGSADIAAAYVGGIVTGVVAWLAWTYSAPKRPRPETHPAVAAARRRIEDLPPRPSLTREYIVEVVPEGDIDVEFVQMVARERRNGNA